MRNGDRERLIDMLEAIEDIERYAARGRADYDADELVRSWMRQHLQIIGEAAAALTEALRQRHPEVAWREAIGMRHVLMHGYRRVNDDVVWRTVAEDVPVLKGQLAVILESLDG